MASDKDRKIIRECAKKWMELASLPVMEERKRLWTAVHDLKAERPVIMIETSPIEGFITEDMMLCEDPYLRAVERNMRRTIRQAEELGDDIVVEPYYRIAWDIEIGGFGVDVDTKPATTSTGETSLGYSFSFPVRTPEDVNKLKERDIRVNREATGKRKNFLEDMMGDILPVKVGNFDPFLVNHGDDEWAGMFFFGLTWQIFRFIGNDHLLYWLYDETETMHKLMRYMVEDRKRLFTYMEREQLLVPNTDNQMAGPRDYGYVSELPGPDKEEGVTLKDLWGWPESQESTIISPEMYREFILPYLAELSGMFGLVYYGCCEAVDDRFEMIAEGMPNLRSVSISGWADFKGMAEKLGKNYVYSRKPTPAFLSADHPDWDLVKEDMQETYDAAKNCNVELLFRDLYTVNGDINRLKRWVDMTKSIFGM